MTPGTTEASPGVPSRPGRRALAVGTVIAAVLLVSLALTQLALDRIPFGPGGALNNLRIATVHCLLIAYLPAAYLFLRHSARRTLIALRPGLAIDESAFQRLVAEAGTLSKSQLALGAIIGLGVSYLGPFLSGPGEDQPWQPSTWTPEVAWHRVLGLALGIWIGWFSWLVVRESQRLSKLGGALAPLDLLDLRPLAPFTQQGLSHALLTTGFLAIFGLFMVDQGITPLIAIVTPLTLALAMASLLLPRRGVRDRIRAAKSVEIGWVDRALRDGIDALRAAPREPPARNVADLIAYRQLIERVREWPFDTSALARVVLYLLIPLGSWLASALVGAAVERWFFME